MRKKMSLIIILIMITFFCYSYAVQEQEKEAHNILKSKIIQFLPDNLPEDQKWLNIYGKLQENLIAVNPKDYRPLLEVFQWWMNEILKKDIIPDSNYLINNIQLIPYSSFVNHKEDIAYLKFASNKADYLVAQTGGEGIGRIFIFVKDKEDQKVMINEITKWDSKPEYIEIIEWTNGYCIIINKRLYRKKNNRIVASAGPAADKWFSHYKTVIPEPEKEISHDEVCAALEKLPPAERNNASFNYKMALTYLKSNSMTEEQRKFIESQRNRAAIEILKRAEKSQYSEEARKKEFDELDKKVADAMELVRLFYKNGYKENYWEEYHKLRKAFDNLATLTPAQRIELESKINSAAAPILSEAQYLEQARNGKEYLNKIKSLEKDFLTGKGIVCAKAFEELVKENRMEIIVKGLSRQDDFSVKLMAAEAIKKAPYMQFLPEIIVALKADNIKIEGSESEIITHNSYKKNLIESIEKLTKEHSEITDYNDPEQVENFIKQTKKFLKEENQKENQEKDTKQ